MPSESLKDYLVKIGWDVDEKGFNLADSKMKSFRSSIENMGHGMAASIAKSGLFITDTILGITSSMFSLVENIASADLATEKFARQMWTTEQNARSVSTALDVLGTSYEELFYATEEEYSRFLELNRLGKTLEAPPALEDTLVKIRDIQFEISKTKEIFSYASRWVVYYIGKMTGSDIEDVGDLLNRFNSFIIEKLPKYTKVIAEFFTFFYKMGKTAFTVLYRTGSAFVEVLDRIGPTGTKSIALISAALLALRSGPLGLVISGISMLLLLLEDFLVWQKGGKSLFGDKWQVVQDIFSDMKETFGDTGESIGEILSSFKELADTINLKQGIFNFFKTTLEGINVAVSGIASFLDLINITIKAITGQLTDEDKLGAKGKAEKFKEKAYSLTEKLAQKNPVLAEFGLPLILLSELGVKATDLFGRNGSAGSGSFGREIIQAGGNSSQTTFNGDINLTLPNVTNANDFANELPTLGLRLHSVPR